MSERVNVAALDDYPNPSFYFYLLTVCDIGVFPISQFKEEVINVLNISPSLIMSN